MRRSLSAATVACAAVVALSVVGGFIADVRARELQLSRMRLDRIDEFFSREIASGSIPGAVVQIQRRGQPVYTRTFGACDVATGARMTTDTIFRLFSMSKQITAVAAMMLVEEGKLSLTDPLSKYIPAFANVKVGVAHNGDPVLVLVAPDRPIMIQDLLRHSSGLAYDYVVFGPIKQAYIEADVLAGDFDNAEFAERVARLPLAYQPGTTWAYGYSFDILGRVIEVISGKSLLQFEQERLLGPLGMRDTGFYAPRPDQQDRIAEPLPGERVYTNPRVRKRWQSGGAGMVSTAADLMRFFQMLLDGGTFEGRQYLSRKTIDLMFANGIGPAAGIRPWLFYYPGAGYGFGLGFAVRTEAGVSPWAGSVGQVEWGGGAGTYFWIDRQEDMVVLLMIQSPTQRGRIQSALKSMVYAAFEN